MYFHCNFEFCCSAWFLFLQIENNVYIFSNAGPRICLGKQLAESELFLIFVSILQRFDLSKADENDDLPIDGTMTGLTQQPKNFQMCFLPRQ